METYRLLRALADSWALLAMFLFFVGPSSGSSARGRARSRTTPPGMIFRNETEPKDDRHGR